MGERRRWEKEERENERAREERGERGRRKREGEISALQALNLIFLLERMRAAPTCHGLGWRRVSGRSSCSGSSGYMQDEDSGEQRLYPHPPATQKALIECASCVMS